MAGCYYYWEKHTRLSHFNQLLELIHPAKECVWIKCLWIKCVCIWLARASEQSYVQIWSIPKIAWPEWQRVLRWKIGVGHDNWSFVPWVVCHYPPEHLRGKKCYYNYLNDADAKLTSAPSHFITPLLILLVKAKCFASDRSYLNLCCNILAKVTCINQGILQWSVTLVCSSTGQKTDNIGD